MQRENTLQAINNNDVAVNVYSKSDVDAGLNLKANKLNTYPQAEINVAFGTLGAEIDNIVLMNAVDINGKFKISAVSHDILKIQRVDGTTLHDSFELSFNPVDETIIVAINNVNLLQAVTNNDVAVNVYSKSAVHTGLNLKSDKFNTYPEAEISLALGILRAAIDNRG